MAVPAHTRLTITGIFGDLTAPTEIWSFSLGAGALANSDGLQGSANALKVAYTTHLAGLLPASAKATRFRVSRHEALTGNVSLNGGGGYDQADALGDVVGQGPNVPVYPLSTALCVSLGSTRAGPTGKGRFFLPMPGLSLGADFLISPASAQTIATACGNFVRSCNRDVLPVALAPGVAIVSSKGYLTAVTSLRVGRVPDTMRSRRNGQVEGYVNAGVALP